MKAVFIIDGLDCAHCAAKLEKQINDMPEIKNAKLDFLASRLIIEGNKDSIQKAITLIKESEPQVKITKKEQEHNSSANSKPLIFRLAGGILLFAAGIISSHEVLRLSFFLSAYLLTGYDVLFKAFKKIIRLSALEENFLMALATIGAFCTGNYGEGVSVMILYQVGELFQSGAVNKSRKSIKELMDIRPDYANLLLDGKIKKVNPSEVKEGFDIIIKPGEKIPLDCKVTDGKSTVDTSALTGESIPTDVFEGDELLSGSINISGVLTAKVTKTYSQSTVSKILELVENASSGKTVSERFISVFASYYTPIVVGLAAAFAFLPPLIIKDALFSDWIYRALTFLVISCPCALVISVPLGFFCGIGSASQKGILVKGSNFLEALSKAETVVFDKTGTLTEGRFSVREIQSENPQELLRLGAYAQYYSDHPIAKSIKAAYGKDIDASQIEDFEEIRSVGVKAKINGVEVVAGNEKILSDTIENASGKAVYLTADGKYMGAIIISDAIKTDSLKAISSLKKEGIKNTVMLTGDSFTHAAKVAEELGISEFHAELLPQDKVERMKNLLNKKSPKGKVIFAGDGINDAPALALSDIGVAMGGIGSDAAIEAADVVIMSDELSKLSVAIRIARKTMSVVKQNIVFSLLIKLAVLLLGALGIAHMWLAIFADVGVAALCILNSVRLLKK